MEYLHYRADDEVLEVTKRSLTNLESFGRIAYFRPDFGLCHFSGNSRKCSCIQAQECSERTYLGTQPDIWPRSGVIGKNVYSASVKVGFRVFSNAGRLNYLMLENEKKMTLTQTN